MLCLQSAEVFPTSIRGTAMGVVNLAGRVGGILAPFVTNLDKGELLVFFK